ncbi:MAG: hypothetical protein ACLFTI_12505 [Anaerolineales bacterium]
MQKWDYTHIIVRVLPGYSDKWTVRSSVRSLDHEDSGDFYPMLFRMGEQGWEIMELQERIRDNDGASVIVFWLKRPKQELPSISKLERKIAKYAIDELDGKFVLRKLHQAHKDEITYNELRELAYTWEKQGFLIRGVPRKLSKTFATLCKN